MVVNASTVVWHDLECGSYTADLRLWRELASTAAGPVLEIGAGSGRVTLDLARNGHRVTALDLDAQLLAALRERAEGPFVDSVATVCADARSFELERRDFALCVVPMQTLQLFGGTDGRRAFLARARAHLRPCGMLACAIAVAIESFDRADGDFGPPPEVAEVAGMRYRSHVTRVRVEPHVARIERERSIGGAMEHERDVVELDRVSVAALQREGRDVELCPAGTRSIPETDEHAGAVVVLFDA